MNSFPPAKSRHLFDASNLTPDEIEMLRSKQQQAQRRFLEPPMAPLFVPGSSAAADPQAQRELPEWRCPLPCGRSYRAVRCQQGCPDCEQKRVVEARYHRRVQIHALAMAPAGEDFQHVTLQHPQLRQWVTSAKVVSRVQERADLDYDEEGQRWPQLVLLGGTGAGKTTLATAVFRHHADRVLAPDATEADEEYVRAMLWVPAVELAGARRETRFGQAVDLLKRALTATVLLIDDLGQEPPDWRDDMKTVLSERQRHRRKTILTSGFSLEEIASYGDHIQRRLVERSHVLQMESKWRPSGPTGQPKAARKKEGPAA